MRLPDSTLRIKPGLLITYSAWADLKNPPSRNLRQNTCHFSDRRTNPVPNRTGGVMPRVQAQPVGAGMKIRNSDTSSTKRKKIYTGIRYVVLVTLPKNLFVLITSPSTNRDAPGSRHSRVNPPGISPKIDRARVAGYVVFRRVWDQLPYGFWFPPGNHSVRILESRARPRFCSRLSPPRRRVTSGERKASRFGLALFGSVYGSKSYGLSRFAL
jgi:hypothetical protein